MGTSRIVIFGGNLVHGAYLFGRVYVHGQLVKSEPAIANFKSEHTSLRQRVAALQKLCAQRHRSNNQRRLRGVQHDQSVECRSTGNATALASAFEEDSTTACAKIKP